MTLLALGMAACSAPSGTYDQSEANLDGEYSLWPSAPVPAHPADPDTQGVELGVKFKASSPGIVTGVRFYKASSNTGSHSGHLWTAGGQLLASVKFINESASGWQTVRFEDPVKIQANTVYVMSYYSPNGHYAGDNGYFSSRTVRNGPLTALRDGTAGGNGVYHYGSAPGFPSDSWNASNYWVDLLFVPSTATDAGTPDAGTSSDATAPTVTISAPTAGATVTGTLVIQGTASDNVGVTGVQVKVDGAAFSSATGASAWRYSINTQALTNGAHTLTVQARDAAGNIGSGTRAINVQNTSTPTRKWKIWALGDSITEGNTGAEINGYRAALWTNLTGYSVDFVGSMQQGNNLLPDKDFDGHSGACILTQACYSITMYPLTSGWLNTYQPDIIIMQGGNNDMCCTPGVDETVVAGYMSKWIDLMWSVRPDAGIILIGAVGYKPTYDRLLKQHVSDLAAQGKRIQYVRFDDIDTLDGTHPSTAGFKTLADRLAPLAKAYMDGTK